MSKIKPGMDQRILPGFAVFGPYNMPRAAVKALLAFLEANSLFLWDVPYDPGCCYLPGPGH